MSEISTSRLSELDREQCDICGIAGLKVFLPAVRDRLRVVERESTYVRCPSCGLIALFPIPEHQDTRGFYPEAYWRISEEPTRLPAIKRLEAWYRNRLMQADFKSIRPFFGPKTRHLDVGCATGDFMSIARSETGCDTMGIEMSVEAAAYCVNTRGLRAVSGDLVAHDFKGMMFDVITYNGVLEHLTNPFEHLIKCRELLRPGGKLLVRSLPNIESLGYRVAGENWIGLDSPRHIFLFTTRSIRTLLEMAGYRVYSVDSRSPRHNPASLVASFFPPLHRHRFDLYEARTGRNPIFHKVLLILLLQPVRPLSWVASCMGWGEVINCVAEPRDFASENTRMRSQVAKESQLS